MCPAVLSSVQQCYPVSSPASSRLLQTHASVLSRAQRPSSVQCPVQPRHTQSLGEEKTWLQQRGLCSCKTQMKAIIKSIFSDEGEKEREEKEERGAFSLI